MKNLLAELPPNTFCLQSAEVPEFVEIVAAKYDISDPVAELCVDGLNELFRRQGGFYEPPADPNAFWQRYHNGSHGGCVFGVAVGLAHIAGESKNIKDAAALAAVKHDKYKGSPIPGEDEKLSALDGRDEADSHGLQRIATAVFKGIMGTIVDELGADIVQRARKTGGRVGKYLADSDLASMVAPNAAEWSGRLYAENNKRIELPNAEELVSALTPTILLGRTHKFLSKPGREILQPLAVERISQLEKLIENKDLKLGA